MLLSNAQCSARTYQSMKNIRGTENGVAAFPNKNCANPTQKGSDETMKDGKGASALASAAASLCECRAVRASASDHCDLRRNSH
jgi:hypothetical protein